MNHKELEAWKVAMDLVEVIYRLTERFPREEMWGLTSQVRRAAVSIASNVSEGAARSSRRDFANFIDYALGSTAEVETQVLIAKRLGWLSDDQVFERIDRERSLLIGLRRRLRSN